MKNILKLGFAIFGLMILVSGCGKKGSIEYPGGQQKPIYDRDLDPDYANIYDGGYSNYDGNSPVTKRQGEAK